MPEDFDQDLTPDMNLGAGSPICLALDQIKIQLQALLEEIRRQAKENSAGALNTRAFETEAIKWITGMLREPNGYLERIAVALEAKVAKSSAQLFPPATSDGGFVQFGVPFTQDMYNDVEINVPFENYKKFQVRYKSLSDFGLRFDKDKKCWLGNINHSTIERLRPLAMEFGMKMEVKTG